MVKQLQLRELDFTDRVFISLSVEPDLSAIQLEAEAYLPEGPERRLTKLGWIRCALEKVTKADIRIKPGFHHDMSLPYHGIKGDDVRGNEIYALTEDEATGDGRFVRLVSDLLELEVVCQTVRVTVLESK